MIKNLWGMMNVFCENGHEKTLMETGYRKGIMVYKCPICDNYITLNDFEKAVNKISEILYEAELNDEMICLDNHKWTRKGIQFFISNHTNKKIDITINNKGAIK